MFPETRKTDELENQAGIENGRWEFSKGIGVNIMGSGSDEDKNFKQPKTEMQIGIRGPKQVLRS
jgi:hypothetical protein